MVTSSISRLIQLICLIRFVLKRSCCDQQDLLRQLHEEYSLWSAVRWTDIVHCKTGAFGCRRAGWDKTGSICFLSSNMTQMSESCCIFLDHSWHLLYYSDFRKYCATFSNFDQFPISSLVNRLVHILCSQRNTRWRTINVTTSMFSPNGRKQEMGFCHGRLTTRGLDGTNYKPWHGL